MKRPGPGEDSSLCRAILVASQSGGRLRVSSLRAAHAIAAIEAAIASSAANGQGPAVVAGWRIALELSELPLSRLGRLPLEQRQLRDERLGAEDGLGMFQIGHGCGAMAVDLDHRRGGTF